MCSKPWRLNVSWQRFREAHSSVGTGCFKSQGHCQRPCQLWWFTDSAALVGHVERTHQWDQVLWDARFHTDISKQHQPREYLPLIQNYWSSSKEQQSVRLPCLPGLHTNTGACHQKSLCTTVKLKIFKRIKNLNELLKNYKVDLNCIEWHFRSNLS